MEKSVIDSLELFVRDEYVKTEYYSKIHPVCFSMKQDPEIVIPGEKPSKCSIQEKHIDEWIDKTIQPSFNEVLFHYIDSKKIEKDSEVYKKAGVDRKTFSKIRSSKKYKPSKSTVIALALALELDEDEAEELFEAAGYALTYNQKFDLTVRFCILNRIYNLMQVNELLCHVGQRVL
ncbi:MAG: hypothetical protein EOM59_00920 [Clostridia bacterium]|nr:hypothetical protein [Clostridia bacterium]